jgi:hypothetical protein
MQKEINNNLVKYEDQITLCKDNSKMAGKKRWGGLAE